MRVSFLRYTLFAGVVAVFVNVAAAQTNTPTHTPAATSTPTPTRAPLECVGSRKLYVTWVAKDPLNLRVGLSATGCPEIFDCDGSVDGELVSQPPTSFTVIDANGVSLSKTITDLGVNTGGCPGGHDTYRGLGRLRFVFGESTTVIGKQRVAQAQNTPPTLTPPLRVTFNDAGGVLYTYVVNTCYPRISELMTSLKCF
jgi:hypothetical protein